METTNSDPVDRADDARESTAGASNGSTSQRIAATRFRSGGPIWLGVFLVLASAASLAAWKTLGDREVANDGSLKAEHGKTNEPGSSNESDNGKVLEPWSESSDWNVWSESTGGQDEDVASTVRPGLSTTERSPSSAEWNKARDDFEKAYGRAADEIDVASWLAESLSEANRLEDAVACFDRIPTDHPKYGIAARVQQAHLLLRLNRAYDSEFHLTEVLNRARVDSSIDPTRLLQALDLKRYLLAVELRFEERKRILEIIHAMDVGGKEEVTTFCFPSLLRWNGPSAIADLEGFWKEDPDRAVLRTALARYRTGEGRLDEAREILEARLREKPDDLRAVSALLECLWEEDDVEEFARRYAQLPPPAADEPWLLLQMRGNWLNRQSEHEEALRVLALLLENDPANPTACQGQITAFRALGRKDELQEAVVRSQKLGQIQNRLGLIQTVDDPYDGMRETAELALEIGLEEQAAAVARFLRRAKPGTPLPPPLADLLAKERSTPSAAGQDEAPADRADATDNGNTTSP